MKLFKILNNNQERSIQLKTSFPIDSNILAHVEEFLRPVESTGPEKKCWVSTDSWLEGELSFTGLKKCADKNSSFIVKIDTTFSP